MEVDPKLYENIALSENVVNDLILSYLIHNGYKESSESFIACTGMNRHADDFEKMEKRKRIVRHTMEGDTLIAIDLMDELSPRILDSNKLLFDVISLHFVGLVLSRKWLEAVMFAQTNMGPFGMHPLYSEKVKDFTFLLAFENPLESPVCDLVGEGFRQQVLDNLNLAILAHFNLPSRSVMERLIRHTTVVRDILTQLKELPPFSLRNFLRDRLAIY